MNEENSTRNTASEEGSPGLTKRERKELKKQEKQLNKEKAFKQRKIKKIGRWVIAIVAVVVLVGLIWAAMPESEPLGPDYSQAMPHEGQNHLAEGTPVEYQSNPPTSGDHWPQALRDGLYDEEKPDEAIVHSLEHGRVWVSYHPDVSEEVVGDLRDLLQNEHPVILTPREANDTDIALAAWNRLDTFDLPEGQLNQEFGKRILDFIERYKHKGPEFIPGPGPGKTYE